MSALEGGGGDFDRSLAQFISMGGEYRGLKLHVTRKLASGHTVVIETYSRLKDGEAAYEIPAEDDMTPVDLTRWDRPTYSLKLKKLDVDRVFAFDLHDDGFGHHVHMRPNTQAHVPASDVIPNTTSMAPIDFVTAVNAYLTDGTYPVTRTTNR